jgi:uncharacterized protein YggE
MRFLHVLLVAAVLHPASAAAQPAPERETVSVTGTGRASVAPDRAVFTVGVQTVAETVEAAMERNNERVARVIAALEAAGADEKGIRTSSFSLVPQHDQREGALARIVGYQVSNAITVRTGKVAEAGRLLQAAVKAGVNTVSSLRLEVTDPAKNAEEALRAAFADARAQALVLAQAAGRSLGPAVRIAASGRDGPPQPYARAMALGAEAEVPVAAGTQEIVHTVSVSFELR